MTIRVYLCCVLGIVISVVLPILRVSLPKATASSTTWDFWADAKPYVITGLFSALAAIVIIAGSGATADTWGCRAALMAGYAWDSTLQKFAKG
jgi:hypothetical protein